MATTTTTKSLRDSGLSRQVLGLLIALIVQFGIGISVNLYAHLPKKDAGANVGAAFGKAIANGPVGLAIHAILGVLLVVGSIGVVATGVRLKNRVVEILGILGVLFLIGAAMSGAKFVGAAANSSSANSASLTMALLAAATMIDYAVLLFLAGND